MHPYSFEKVSVEELGRIMGLDQACFGERAFSEDFWRATCSAHNVDVLMLQDGQKDIGLAYFRSLTGGCLLDIRKRKSTVERYIGCLAIHPEHQGKGLGTSFLEKIEDFKLEETSRRFQNIIMTAEVSLTNAPSNRVFGKSGYQTNHIRTDVYPDIEGKGRHANVFYKAKKSLSGFQPSFK